MTTHDYLIVMRRVRTAQLKARISEYLRHVRLGHSLIVLDRDNPIARIVPFEPNDSSWIVKKPNPDAPPLSAIRLPPRLKTRVNAVALLLEDRRREG